MLPQHPHRIDLRFWYRSHGNLKRPEPPAVDSPFVVPTSMFLQPSLATSMPPAT